MSFVSNLVVLHAREGFEDYDDPDEKRHLRRLWLASAKTPHRPPLLQMRYDHQVVAANKAMVESGA